MPPNCTVFAKSELFEKLHEQNLLSTIELQTKGSLFALITSTKKNVRRYFAEEKRTKAEEALIQLKDEGSYPYQNAPQGDIDKVERRVFDLCAINISRHLPSFSNGMDVDGRKLLLKMVREALSQNPSSVGKIIREVCRLPDDDAITFSRLLEDIPLKHLVNASRQVVDRLQFLDFFEAMVYLDPFERVVYERTELHKILSSNTWLFGEEYSNGTDDAKLERVLRKHVEILGRNELQPSISQADLDVMLEQIQQGREKTEISLERIPDLMLWKHYLERRPDEYEFLVIEIKRPGVSVGRKEIAQIEDYAKAIITTPLADKQRTTWVFAVISDTLDDHAEDRISQDGLPRYTILKKSAERYEIRAYPWSAIIQSARARHNHLREWLSHNVDLDKALESAQQVYDTYLPKPKLKVVGAKAQKRG